jgi:hypothetical protein
LLTSKSADFKKFPPSLLGIKNLQNQRRVDLSIFLAAHFKPNTKNLTNFQNFPPYCWGLKTSKMREELIFLYFWLHILNQIQKNLTIFQKFPPYFWGLKTSKNHFIFDFSIFNFSIWRNLANFFSKKDW